MNQDQKTPRHPGTENLMRWLTPNPNLPAGLPSKISNWFYDLAVRLVEELPDGPELVAGLRKLLEAKDCMVRAAIELQTDVETQQRETDPEHEMKWVRPGDMVGLAWAIRPDADEPDAGVPHQA